MSVDEEFDADVEAVLNLMDERKLNLGQMAAVFLFIVRGILTFPGTTEHDRVMITDLIRETLGEQLSLMGGGTKVV